MVFRAVSYWRVKPVCGFMEGHVMGSQLLHVFYRHELQSTHGRAATYHGPATPWSTRYSSWKCKNFVVYFITFARHICSCLFVCPLGLGVQGQVVKMSCLAHFLLYFVIFYFHSFFAFCVLQTQNQSNAFSAHTQTKNLGPLSI